MDVQSKKNRWENSPYQELFEHMSNEHGLTLLQSELQEIVSIVGKIDTTDFGFEVIDLEDDERNDKLKEKMQSVGLSAYRLAQLSGVSQATISRMKKGNNCMKENWDAVWKVLNNQKK